MAQKEVRFIVAIEDVNTGEVEEQSFSSYDKAVALCEMIDRYNGENKIVELFNEKGEAVEF